MSLRKALDRAKKERKNDLLSVGSGSSKKEQETTFAEENNHFSPVYSKSRHIQLDRKILEKNLCVSYFTDSLEGDHYKAIRTQIVKKMRENGWSTLLITSALPGEGKSITTINLAVTFAKELHQPTVLLVDADLRRQNIHKCLGYENKVGLTEYIINDVPLEELIIWPGIDKLSIISGGDTVRDSTEIISSKKMRLLIDEMKNRYEDRFIIFDSPPILTCPDTIAFVPFVDAVVMVVEAEKTTVEEVEKAKSLIPPEKFLGFILNKNQRRGAIAKKYASYY